MSRAPETWTIQRTLAWAAKDFHRRGLESPRLDAELLLAHALGTERIRLFIEADRELSAESLARYRELIQRRRAREPVAYILGVREFYGLEFRVDRRVLVPRPDTETLVEEALERTRSRDMYGRALDLCTGSGCVAITFARQRPTWRTTGVELDPGALELARENAARLGVVFSTRFLEGDLFAPLGPTERFDLITANPPYVPREELSTLEPDVREFEPRLALLGGEDGLDVVRRIMSGARPWLEPGGTLALEIGSDQGERTVALMTAAGYSDVRIRRDYAGRDRVVSGLV